jgi:cobalt/nickel transport system ATP-binding protein
VSEAVLEVIDVEFAYPDGTKALKGVHLTIPRGKRVAVLGPNGAGKTTLFLTFNGLIRPSRGKLRFGDRDVTYNRSFLKWLRQKVGMVFQDPDAQLFAATVWQDVSFGPINLGLPKEEVARRVEESLALTGISHLRERATHFLSYGEKKCVAIAGVLAMRPELLVCDEPTAWLDPRQSHRIMKLFTEIRDQGITVVFSTHDVDLAYTWSDYVCLLKEGRVLAAGTPERVFADEALLALADLNPPWILEIWKTLRIDHREPPKTREDLVAFLKARLRSEEAPPSELAVRGESGYMPPSTSSA